MIVLFVDSTRFDGAYDFDEQTVVKGQLAPGFEVVKLEFETQNLGDRKSVV